MNPARTFRSSPASAGTPAPFRAKALGLLLFALFALVLSSSLHAAGAVRVLLRGTFTAGPGGYGSCEIALGHGGAAADAGGNIEGMVFLVPGDSYELALDAWQMQALTLNILAPSGYRVWLDASARKRIQLFNQNPSEPVTEVYQLEIRPEGAGGGAGTGGGVSLGDELAWGVNLGRLYNGNLAGSLVIRSEGLSGGMFDRGNLAFRGVEQQQVSMIYDTQGRPRQVIAPEVFVDINDLYNGSTVNGFSLDFYPRAAMGEADGSGLRAIDPGSDYFVRHTVKLAGGALVASRQAGANIQTSQITQQGGAWMKSTAGELLVETVETLAGDPSGTRVEITTVKDGAGNVARKTKRIHQTFPWANISPDPDTLVDVIVDPDGAALATHYEYYTDAAFTGSYGQIESISYPDGSWAKYEYYEEGETGFGHIKREYHPWLDFPASPGSATAGNCHVIEYTYTADWDGEEQLVASRIEKINGVVTARQETEHSFWEDTGTEFTAYDPQKFWKQRTETWTDGDANSEPLVSEIIRFRYDQEEYSAATNGMVYSVTQPDGSRTAWFRSRGQYDSNTHYFSCTISGSAMLEIAYHGMAAAGDGRVSLGELWMNDPYGGFTDEIHFVPGRSTKTVRIKKNGRIMREETHVYAKRDNVCAGYGDCDFCNEGGDCAGCDYCYDYHDNPMAEEGFVLVDWKNNTYTDSGRLARVESGGGFLYEATWVDGFKAAEKGSDGIEYTYSPDAVMRVARVVKSGVPATSIDGVPVAAQGHVATDYTYNAAGNITGRTTTDDDGLQLQETFAYDLAGRPVSRTAPDGDITVTTHGTRTRTTTYPGGATRIVQTFRDGQMKSETGTAIVGVHYAHGIGDGGFRWVETRAGSATSAAKTKNTYDWAGRLRAAETPAMAGAGGVNTQTHAYDALGRLVRTETPGLAPTLYEYDSAGALRAQGLLCGGNDTDTGDPRAALDPALGDRVIEFENQIVLNAGETGLAFWREEKSRYRAGSGALFRSHARARLSGLSPALASQIETFDAHGNKTIQTSAVDRDARLVTHTATVPGSNIQAVSHVYNGLLVDSRDAQGRLAGYDYDSLGRPVRVRRPGKTAVETVYETGSDRVQRTQFADDAHTLITAYEYDAAGNISRATDAAGATVSHTYNQRGQLLARFGTGAAPVACEYDALGRLTQQTTWGGAATDTLPVDDDAHKNVTTFEYLSDFALLTKVTDALGHATEYAHDALGRLTTLSRARKLASDGATPVTVTHAYDPLTGELTGKTYNDGTPAVSLAYNAFGQPATITDALGARAFAYAEDGTGRLLSETLPAYYQDAAASPSAGPGLRRLSYTYDTGVPHAAGSAYAPLAGRLKTVALVNSSDEAETTASHWFLGDAQPGRIEVADATAPDGLRAFHYSWMPQQPGLLQQAVELQTGLARTCAYEDALWDQPTRVRTGIDLGSGAGTGSVTLADGALTYDALGRPATLQQSGALFAGYGEALHRDYHHDLRGQLLAARSYMGLAGDNDRPMPGRHHTFSYDNAGARTAAGHDESLPQAETVNALGQLTGKENKSVHVSGVAVEGAEAALAVAGAAVTVMRSGSASGRFWSIELSPDSATDDTAAKASTLVRLQKTAAGPGGANVSQTLPVELFMHPKQETFLYDADGNLVSDGQWDYVYDAENRLVAQRTKDALVPALLALSGGERPLWIKYTYDYQNRRAGKQVFEKVDGEWEEQQHHRYVYEGGKVIAEIDANTHVLLRAFAWGATGELLMINDRTGATTTTGGSAGAGDTETYLPVHDATGGVAGLVRASDNTLVAVYEYDPCGNLLRAQGGYAKKNPFTWRGGWTDWETGQINAGSYYYAPRLGRIINSAPSGDGDGTVLYYGESPTAGRLAPRRYAPPAARLFSYVKSTVRMTLGQILLGAFDATGYDPGSDADMPFLDELSEIDEVFAWLDAWYAPPPHEYIPSSPGVCTCNNWDGHCDGCGASEEAGDSGGGTLSSEAIEVLKAAVAASIEQMEQDVRDMKDEIRTAIDDFTILPDGWWTFSDATNNVLAAQTGGNTQVTRGSDELRAGALAYYGGLPVEVKKKISDTFLTDMAIYEVKTTSNGKVVSEYQFSIGRYQKKDGTVYYLSTDVVYGETPADAMMSTVMGLSPEWKTSLKTIIDFHSHADNASPGLSFMDRGGYRNGVIYDLGNNNRVSIPREYSGAFYGKEQIFYGWSSNGEYYLTFEEMRNALR